MKIFTLIALFALVVGGGFLFFGQNKEAVAPTNTQETEQMLINSATEQEQQEPAGPQQHAIAYTDEGYSPKSLMIKAGDTVVWTNNSAQDMWTATALHPTHTVYPGSDIKNCGGESAKTMFDSCQRVARGESWSFLFTEQGTWNYHNHVGVSHTGSIIVQK